MHLVEISCKKKTSSEAVRIVTSGHPTPPCMDLHQIWHRVSPRRPDHQWQLFWRSDSLRSRILPFSYLQAVAVNTVLALPHSLIWYVTYDYTTDDDIQRYPSMKRSSSFACGCRRLWRPCRQCCLEGFDSGGSSNSSSTSVATLNSARVAVYSSYLQRQRLLLLTMMLLMMMMITGCCCWRFLTLTVACKVTTATSSSCFRYIGLHFPCSLFLFYFRTPPSNIIRTLPLRLKWEYLRNKRAIDKQKKMNYEDSPTFPQIWWTLADKQLKLRCLFLHTFCNFSC